MAAGNLDACLRSHGECQPTAMKMQEFEAFSSAGHWVLKKKKKKKMQTIMPNVVKSQYIQECDAIQMLLYPALVISETIFLLPPF